MKKILLFTTFILLSTIGFSQWKSQDIIARYIKCSDISFTSATGTNISIIDSVLIGDSSYITEETDTLRISSPKNVKIGNSSLIVERDGDVLASKNLTVIDTLKYNILDPSIDSVRLSDTSNYIRVKNVTYYELSALITSKQLNSGNKYCLTDFATAYNIFDGGRNTVIEAQLGTTEPLLLLATSDSTLAKEAYSKLYPQDIIYYNPSGANVINDIAYSDGSGTLIPTFKGIIEFRHDTKQNVSTWYDFRNIKFRRWAVDAVAYDGSTKYVAKDVCKSGINGNIYKCITATIGEGDPTVNTADWILLWDITADAYISWTSDKAAYEIGDITTDNLVFVPATYQDLYTFGSWYQHVHDVSIGHNDLTLAIDFSYNTTLNNIVFKTIDDIYTCYVNEIKDFCYNVTIGTGFIFNTIGTGFIYNTIGNTFFLNTIGNYFYSNTIGNNSKSNTIGNNSKSNTIGNNFYFNTIGNDFYSNTIGNNSQSNTIGNNFSSNTIGNGFYSNTIGNDFSSNTIGNDFSSNTIWNNFYYNTIGNSFKSNTIGNTSHVVAGINCTGISIGDYNTLITLGDACTGISIGDYNTLITLGDACTGISIGEKNDTITLGASCSNLVFHNGYKFNSVTPPTGINNIMFTNGIILNGGLYNKDTVISLANNGTYNFPTASVGFAEIQCDSVLTEKTWAEVSWNGDGATTLRSHGAKVIGTDTVGNYICFYDGGSTYAVLKNTSGYTQTYSIKYHYHY